MPYNSRGEPTVRNTIHKLTTTVRLHHHTFDSIRKTTGLGRAAHRMLLLIAEKEAPCSQTEIAEIVNASQQYISKIIKKDGRYENEKSSRKSSNAEKRKIAQAEYQKNYVRKKEKK